MAVAGCSQVLHSISKNSPIVLYIRDVDSLLFISKRMYSLFEKLLKRISGQVLILGSRKVEAGSDFREVDEKLSLLFPYNIEIKPPEDETHLVSWKAQLEEDMKMIQFQDNRNHITEVLARNDLDCDDLGSICLTDTMDLSKYIEEIVVSAISFHLMNTADPEYRNGKLVISSKRSSGFYTLAFIISFSGRGFFFFNFVILIVCLLISLSHALSIFQENKLNAKGTAQLEGSADSMKVCSHGFHFFFCKISLTFTLFNF